MIMALAEFEQARVRRAMDAFMQQRRPPPHIRPKLDLGFRVLLRLSARLTCCPYSPPELAHEVLLIISG
jgi:hypothetical protein